jgi:hypothetical protein
MGNYLYAIDPGRFTAGLIFVQRYGGNIEVRSRKRKSEAAPVLLDTALAFNAQFFWNRQHYQGIKSNSRGISNL